MICSVSSAGALSCQTEQRGIELEVLTTGEVLVKTRAELKQRTDTAIDVQGAAVGFGSPQIKLSSVLLPAPLVPTKATFSPRSDIKRHIFECVKALFGRTAEQARDMLSTKRCLDAGRNTSILPRAELCRSRS